MSAVAKLPQGKANGKATGAPGVHLDLDALVREARAEPFTFKLGGDVFTMFGPEDADWQVQAQLEVEKPDTFRDFLREVLGGAEQYEKFAAHRLPAWKLSALLEQCQAHYGTTVPESRASVRSSRDTPGR